jgi:hypothetical protein
MDQDKGRAVAHQVYWFGEGPCPTHSPYVTNRAAGTTDPPDGLSPLVRSGRFRSIYGFIPAKV